MKGIVYEIMIRRPERRTESQRACPCACCNFRDEIDDILLKEG